MDKNTPFMQSIDAEDTINIQGKDTPRAIWNMILTKRDLSLYSKGITPHRNWRLRDVKHYFGLSGTRQTILPRFMKLYEEVMAIYCKEPDPEAMTESEFKHILSETREGCQGMSYEEKFDIAQNLLDEDPGVKPYLEAQKIGSPVEWIATRI